MMTARRSVATTRTIDEECIKVRLAAYTRLPFGLRFSKKIIMPTYADLVKPNFYCSQSISRANRLITWLANWGWTHRW